MKYRVSYSHISSVFTILGALCSLANASDIASGNVLLSDEIYGTYYTEGYETAYKTRIISDSSYIFENNGNFIFKDISVSVQRLEDGGAIQSESLTISQNGNFAFVSNSVTANLAYGGAIYADDSLDIINNKNILFYNNAVEAPISADLTPSAGGGAISGCNVTINNNSELLFIGNHAMTNDSKYFTNIQGGAIDANRFLKIQGNDNVVFRKNYHNSFDDDFQLNSIFIIGDLTLSAKTGGSITIYDSVDGWGGSTHHFNESYIDANGVEQIAGGDIIFSGKYVESDLNEVLQTEGRKRKATEEEISSSYTSSILGTIYLHGGTLQVVDNAALIGCGLTTDAESGAKVILRNGTLGDGMYDFTLNSTGLLSVSGINRIYASQLNFMCGSSLSINVDSGNIENSVLTTSGFLNVVSISLDLEGTEYLTEGNYRLLTCTGVSDYDLTNWEFNGVTSNQLRWENNTLYYVCDHDWNHGVTDDDDISDLEEILGNLIINGGDITLDDVVQAIQDAVDAGFGHGQGHIVINRGGIHITGAGDLDGHIIFNGDLKDIRKLFIEKDITVIKIELGGNSEAENIVDVSDDQTLELGEISGEGSMKKNGKGQMKVTGTNNQVGGTLDVQEGDFIMETGSQTDVHELVLGNEEEKEAKVHVKKNAKVTGDTLQVDGANATLTNDGIMDFTGEVKVTNGHLENNGSISKITLEGGTVSGSGIFAGLEMHNGELVVGNSPGLMSYTDALDMDGGVVVFSLADAAIAATAETAGWDAAAYSTIDMGGNMLTIGNEVNFVLEIGGAALEALFAKEGTTLSFRLNLIQNINADSLTLDDSALAALRAHTTIIITEDCEGLQSGLLYLAGTDISAMLSNGGYSYEGNNLVFRGTITNDGSLTIPEPTTSMLSLLALAGLAARRFRK